MSIQPGCPFHSLNNFNHTGEYQDKMRVLFSMFPSFVLLVSGTNAQFGFFEQMFQGQQQQQAPQNVPSDSSWYQQNYENGMSIELYIHLGLSSYLINSIYSPLLRLFMPWHSRYVLHIWPRELLMNLQLAYLFLTTAHVLTHWWKINSSLVKDPQYVCRRGDLKMERLLERSS